MKDFIGKIQTDLATRMAVLWFLLFTFSSLGGAIITAFYGVKWSQLDGQDRFMLCLLIFNGWATTMMAFFSKAIARASKGEPLITEGDTQLIQRRTETRTVEQTQQQTQPSEIKTP